MVSFNNAAYIAEPSIFANQTFYRREIKSQIISVRGERVKTEPSFGQPCSELSVGSITANCVILLGVPPSHEVYAFIGPTHHYNLDSIMK